MEPPRTDINKAYIPVYHEQICQYFEESYKKLLENKNLAVRQYD